jgi:dTMP kinase
MGLAFHERVCVGFRELAAAEPERCVVVDTRAPMAEVTDTLWRVLCTRYAELQGRDGMVAAADTP